MLLLLLLHAESTHALLVVSAERNWGVATAPEPGWVAVYLLCDESGQNCEPVGIGDSATVRSPLQIDHATVSQGRLRVRFCNEQALESGELRCSGLSEAGPYFQSDSLVGPDEVWSIPDDPVGGAVLLAQGIEVQVRLPIGVRPPLLAELHFLVNGDDPILAVSVYLAHDLANPIEVQECDNCSGPMVLDISDAVEEAAVRGEPEIVVSMTSISGVALLAMDDPMQSDLPAPHMRLSLLPVSLQDEDGDGVPEDGDGSGIEGDLACGTGPWMFCDDNCPDVSNPGQENDGGFNTQTPDRFGNACQRGDVDGNGIVEDVDGALVQVCATGLPPCEGGGVELLPSLGNCDVNGDDRCNWFDGVIIARNVVGLFPCAEGVGHIDGVCQGPTLTEDW